MREISEVNRIEFLVNKCEEGKENRKQRKVLSAEFSRFTEFSIMLQLYKSIDMHCEMSVLWIYDS